MRTCSIGALMPHYNGRFMARSQPARMRASRRYASPLMHAMINMALRAGRRAGRIIVQAMDRVDTLNIVEKQQNDFVSEVDRDAESAIIDILHKAYPDHGIQGEEHGESFAGAEYTWIIDPLDGT